MKIPAALDTSPPKKTGKRKIPASQGTNVRVPQQARSKRTRAFSRVRISPIYLIIILITLTHPLALHPKASSSVLVDIPVTSGNSPKISIDSTELHKADEQIGNNSQTLFFQFYHVSASISFPLIYIFRNRPNVQRAGRRIFYSSQHQFHIF
jgi:hypothetical protein